MRTTKKTSLLVAGIAAIALIPLGSAQAGNSRHGLNLIFDYSDYGHHGHDYYSPYSSSYSYSYSGHRPSHYNHNYGHNHDSCSIHYRNKHRKHNKRHRKHRRHND